MNRVTSEDIEQYLFSAKGNMMDTLFLATMVNYFIERQQKLSDQHQEEK